MENQTIFTLRCTMCQGEKKRSLTLSPELNGQHVLKCNCGNKKWIDDQELAFIVDTLKVATIDY